MSIDVRQTQTLSERVAEEIRVLLARRRMSQAELARRLHVSGAWLNYRLTGKQPIDLNDLQAIADALEVQPIDLLGSGPTGPYSPAHAKRQVKPSTPKSAPIPSPMSPQRPGSKQPSRPPSAPTQHRRPSLIRARHSIR